MEGQTRRHDPLLFDPVRPERALRGVPLGKHDQLQPIKVQAVDVTGPRVGAGGQHQQAGALRDHRRRPPTDDQGPAAALQQLDHPRIADRRTRQGVRPSVAPP